MNNRYIFLLLVLFLVMTAGCSKMRPTIAHTHIGHALTGWHDTPNKKGLFVVAEEKARQSLEAAILAAKTTNNLSSTKVHTRAVLAAIDPVDSAPSGSVTYGVSEALTSAVDHITYAATSDDATENVRQFAHQFESDSQTVLDRCDLITALGNDIIRSKSRDESMLLADEIVRLTRANLHGDDSNGDGHLANVSSEYGLKQLRREIESTLDREDPAYTTVSKWYLFNLIRLPDGSWIFRNRFQDEDDAYDSIGGNRGGY